MSMEGDGPEGQPTEGVTSITDIGAMLDGESEGALEESAQGDEAEESEGVEVEGEESEESEDGGDDGEEAEEPTFTIKVDGKDVTLKQSELIETAQKGFDYTQKTMRVAEESKAVEAQRAKVRALEQQHDHALGETLARLQSFATFMESQVGDPPSIELAHENAAYYIAQKEAYEGQKDKLRQAYAAIHSVQQQQAHHRQAALMQQADETFAHLTNTLPGWKEAPEAKVKELSEYMAPLGLTPQTTADAFVQKGIWELAHKAKAYDALMAEKAKLKPKSELQKVHKPSGNNQPPQLARRQEAVKRHKANPTIQSLADLI